MNLLLFLLLIVSSSFQCKKELIQDIPKINSKEIIQNKLPLFAEKSNIVFTLKLSVSTNQNPLILNELEIVFQEGSRLDGIESLNLKYDSTVSENKETGLGDAAINAGKALLKTNLKIKTGMHFIKLDILLKKNCDLTAQFILREVVLKFANHEEIIVKPDSPFTYRPALILRAHGQDKTDTYRIPGLITTNNGTLIAVYDNRYNNSKDLQEDIDIGMSRSSDGGQTWQPMKVIMDMGEYGGRSQRLNGIGDPCVLYDHKTNTIWVAALWMSGANEKDMLWWASKPGMKPEETGQFILVKSTDDGLTWSEPINITEQIKNPGWQLLLQGPGRGITTTDGTLVFPAQFKAEIGEKALDGGQFTCHSTIVYSKDQGNTWQIGTGAKSNTTEAQVVELTDGSLMLNMRDDRNRKDKSETNGRAVATTKDLGKTWSVHPSSNSALPEPNCMASLISTDVEINGKKHQVLFFSNSNSKTDRSCMTIKASLNGGLTWPAENQVLLNSETSYGYSCMSMIDNKTIGIVYEGVKDLYFQKIPLNDLMGDRAK